MISSERDNRGVTLLGVDPAGEVLLGFEPSSVVAGRWLEGRDDAGVVVGRKLLVVDPLRLPSQCRRLLEDPDLAERMRHANLSYYRRYVRPENHVRNLLTWAFE